MINKKENIITYLNEVIKEPKCELYYNKDYELVLKVMLSAQTTDKKVNYVTKELFKEYNSLNKLKDLSINQIEDKIKELGLYKNKAKYFYNIVNILSKKDYDLSNREFLESLSGIGRKSANVILIELYNKPLIAVDTHVIRVSNRLKLVNTKDINKIENKLYKYFTKEEILYNSIGHRLVLFGRYHCMANKPKCLECKIKCYCKYYEEKRKRNEK